VTGIPSVITDSGAITDVRDSPYAYSRRDLAAGRHDGRRGAFFQQEGTFWTRALWDEVGGINRDTQLAGDWDLWRRMARYTDVVTVRAVLALHRRHPGQLTSQLERYWAEVDALQRAQPQSGDDRFDNIGLVGMWKPDSKTWDLDRSEADRRGERRIVFADSVMPSWVRHVSGLSGVEAWGRWSDASLAPSVRICLFRPLPSRCVLRLTFAVAAPHCSPVVVTAGAHTYDVAASLHPREFELSLQLQSPVDVIDIRPSGSFSPRDARKSDDGRRLGIAFRELCITAA
jgi:hypothetical protein